MAARALLALLLCAIATASGAPSASLHVRWSAAADRTDKISLVPVDAPPASTLTVNVSEGEARWESLPPGTYRLVLRAGDASEAAAPPTDVGEVVLAPGDDRSITVQLPPLTQRRAATARELRISVSNPSGKMTVTLWRDGVRTVVDAATRQVSGASLLTFTAPCAAGSTLAIETPLQIGVSHLDDACSEVRIELTEKTRLSGRVAVASRAAPPSFGVVSAACDARTVEIPFAIEASRFAVSVPTRCSGLSLRAGSFAPVTLQLGGAAARHDLGTIPLVEGAAAAFRIRDARRAELLSDVRVTAVRAHELAAMRGAWNIDRIAVATGVTNASGWVRLAGLPEERIIFLLHAAGRKHPQLSEPYELAAGTETLLDDLLVEPQSNVLVAVTLAPKLEGAVLLDAVELRPEGHSHWPQYLPIRGVLTPSGAVVEDVPPGKWSVAASGRLKNGFAIHAAKTIIDVMRGADHQLALTIDESLYRGRVTRGGSPVAGVVNLKPADRTRGLRSAVATLAADGTFLVLLEQPGEYSLRIHELPSRAGITLGRPVAFGDPDDEVVIELPTGRIRGRVVDGSGAPVAGAGVAASRRIAESAAMVAGRSDAAGDFVLEGVERGTWEIAAHTDAARSEPVVVSFDSEDVSEVRLLLEPTKVVRVRVVDDSGAPVREVFVSISFPGAGVLERNTVIRTTDSDGIVEFRLLQWQQAMPLNIVIITMDLRLSCAVRRLDMDQTLTLPPHTAELRLAGRSSRIKHGVEGWLRSASGCAVPFLGTRRETDGGESVFVFPRLPTGTWSYVETRNPVELAALLTGRAADLPKIQTFTLRPREVLRVTLPK